MDRDFHLGNRHREILTAIVESYIATGEPVGSRTLAQRNSENLSAASIRNVMADLSDAGLLEQPHTSAGRVPTSDAYRIFVNQLTGASRLSVEDENMIRGELRGITDVQEFMERTSHVLSLISRGVGITVAAAGPLNALDHVYFSRLGDKKVLAVVVSKAGVVRDRVLRLREEIRQADLDLAARYINDNFRGWTLESLRSEIARQIEQERSEYDRILHSIEQLYAQGALHAEGPASVYLEGMPNLLANEQDSARLRQVLRVLEEKERIAELLNAYLKAENEAVRVVIGLDQTSPDLRNFVLIGTPVRAGDEITGSLAVIGPTRIDYESTITAVSYIARLFGQILNNEDERKQ
jgi:heat-inducible transcriptional repressor